MWQKLLRTLHEIEEAELTAAAFRVRYARDAEVLCDRMMADMPGSDPRRAAMRQVRRALRWLPVRAKPADR